MPRPWGIFLFIQDIYIKFIIRNFNSLFVETAFYAFEKSAAAFPEIGHLAPAAERIFYAAFGMFHYENIDGLFFKNKRFGCGDFFENFLYFGDFRVI